MTTILDVDDADPRARRRPVLFGSIQRDYYLGLKVPFTRKNLPSVNTPAIVVARKTLNARTEVKFTDERKRYTTIPRTEEINVRREKGKRSRQVHMTNTI